MNFWQSLNLFVESNLWNNALLPIITTGGVVLIVGFFLNKKVEEYKDNLQRNRERELFIGEITNKEKENLLNSWTSLLFDMENEVMRVPEEKLRDKYINMTKNAVMYCSNDIIIIAALFQNFNNHNYIDNNSTDRHYKMIAYIAMMISALKKEFSDINVDPLTLMQIKITDYKNSEINFRNAKKEIEQEIEEYKTYLDTK